MTETPRQLAADEVLDPGRFMDYEAGIVRTDLMRHVPALIDRPGMSLCDIGGASGVFVKEVSRRAAHPVEGWVLEVSDYYRDKQVDPATGFIHASILDSGLADDRFDVVTFRHVLHHLVSDTVAGTLALQRRALSEMVRIVRPGGHLVFVEQVNRVKTFSRLVYHLSSLANRRRLRWRFFEAGTVVVSFMTPGEVAATVAEVGRERAISVLRGSYRPRKVDLRWKLTLLMAFVGDVTYVIRKSPV